MEQTMETEEGTTPEGEPSAPEGEASNHDAHLSKARAERDSAKSKLAALETRIADEKSSAKEKAAKEAGDWQKVLDAKTEKMTAKDQRIAELEKQVGGFEAKGRETSLMDRIFAEAKGDRDDVEASYLLLSKRNGWESAPEDVDAAFKERTKALKTAKPDLFKEVKQVERSGARGVTPPNDAPIDLGALGAETHQQLEGAGIPVTTSITIPGS